MGKVESMVVQQRKARLKASQAAMFTTPTRRTSGSTRTTPPGAPARPRRRRPNFNVTMDTAKFARNMLLAEALHAQRVLLVATLRQHTDKMMARHGTATSAQLNAFQQFVETTKTAAHATLPTLSRRLAAELERTKATTLTQIAPMTETQACQTILVPSVWQLLQCRRANAFGVQTAVDVLHALGDDA
jgi:hypothetical protein